MTTLACPDGCFDLQHELRADDDEIKSFNVVIG